MDPGGSEWMDELNALKGASIKKVSATTKTITSDLDMEMCSWCLTNRLVVNKNANYFCLECNVLLCQDCAKSHRLKQCHKTVPKSTIKFCAACKTAAGCTFCWTCKLNLCDVCAAKHKGPDTSNHKLEYHDWQSGTSGGNEIDMYNVFGLQGSDNISVGKKGSQAESKANARKQEDDVTRIYKDETIYFRRDNKRSTSDRKVNCNSLARSLPHTKSSMQDGTNTDRNAASVLSLQQCSQMVSQNPKPLSDTIPKEPPTKSKQTSLKPHIDSAGSTHVRLTRHVTTVEMSSEYYSKKPLSPPQSVKNEFSEAIVVSTASKHEDRAMHGARKKPVAADLEFEEERYATIGKHEKEMSPSENNNDEKRIDMSNHGMHSVKYVNSFLVTGGKNKQITCMGLLPHGDILLYDDHSKTLEVFEDSFHSPKYSSKVDRGISDLCVCVYEDETRIYAVFPKDSKIGHFFMERKNMRIDLAHIVEMDFGCIGITLWGNGFLILSKEKRGNVNLHMFDHNYTKINKLPYEMKTSLNSKPFHGRRYAISSIKSGAQVVIADGKTSTVLVVDMDSKAVVYRHANKQFKGPPYVVTNGNDTIYILSKGSKNIHKLHEERSIQTKPAYTYVCELIVNFNGWEADGFICDPKKNMLYVSQRGTNKILSYKLPSNSK